MITAILIFLLLAVGYISLILPRLVDRADMSGLDVDYAHRGLHGGDVPENSLAAFEKAAEKRYGIELDVQLTKDGVPVVFHDDSLLRVCGVDRLLRDCELSELRQFRLSGSEKETIPTFAEVLELVDGRVPLLVELKTGSAGLVRAVVPMLDEYNGSFCVESFDPDCSPRWDASVHAMPEVSWWEGASRKGTRKAFFSIFCFFWRLPLARSYG